ncbi:RNA dependent RNA polymerase-domain-containing protein [Russula vinacea]|nr:RNA dependent RNA polymerase-domain-containing protein [Russula vinacea]
MEIELTGIDLDADVYDVRKAVATVLHGPDLYDPNDRENRGRVPNFQVVLGMCPAGHLHNGNASLYVGSKLGRRFIRWNRQSDENNIVVKGYPLKVLRFSNSVPLHVKQVLEKGLYVDPEQERHHSQIGEQARLVRLRIAKAQFGVWCKPSNTRTQRRAFSVEYERDFLSSSAAYLNVVYEQKLIHIDIGQRETEEINYLILVKFSNIRELGISYDELGQAVIILDLHTPPNFEQESYNGRAPEGIKRKWRFKTRDRISSLDAKHALIAPYAHHLRILLAEPDDLLKFERICHIAQCEPRPTPGPCVEARAMGFFSHRDIAQFQCWIKTMEWKNAFQIEAYLRSGLLTTHDLLVTLQEPIEQAIHHYGTEAPEFLRLFMVHSRRANGRRTGGLVRTHAVKSRQYQATSACARTYILPSRVITPSRILLEGPYTTQSNRFRDEDRLAYRWDGDVDGTWFLQQRVGGILRDGFELGGRVFEFLAYSMTSCATTLLAIADAKQIWGQNCAAFTATDPGVKIRRNQWEEQDDLGNHTDGVGTISPQLADMVWEERCKAGLNFREHRIKPSAYQFRFLGYKGVVVVDHRLQGIKMRLRESQRKFPVNDIEEAELEIACSFDYPNPVHLNRPVVMALEDRGVDKEAFIALQERAKASIHLSSDSLEHFSLLLTKYNLGGKFHLAFVLEQLSRLGLDFKDGADQKAIKGAFFERLLCLTVNHSLREIKFKARIPIPYSYQLVGVADEGRAYIKEGVASEDDVFALGPGRIYVCVQKSVHEQPIYLKGTCVISRSPVIHPGDVQRVYAVGEPPEDKICFFRGLKNVVVLPAVGERSMASCLSGDLDGDTYDIYFANPNLNPEVRTDPADENFSTPWMLGEERGDATVEDICDFIVEYINSDVMGLLADRHIVIADQSKDGVFDVRCMKLAKLCSKAIDYATNGNPVDIYNNNLPKQLIKYKPDWHKAEVTGARELEYYVSDRALGYLFRNIEVHDPDEPIEGLPAGFPETTAPLKDPISRVLAPLIQRTLNADDAEPGAENENGHAEQLYAHYVREMQYICVTHTLRDAPNSRLQEEEVVWARSSRMNDIRQQIIQSEETLTEDKLRAGLLRAWKVWAWAQYHRYDEFIESFSLIALGLMFDYFERLGGLPHA